MILEQRESDPNKVRSWQSRGEFSGSSRELDVNNQTD